jgi:hypothetical protein
MASLPGDGRDFAREAVTHAPPPDVAALRSDVLNVLGAVVARLPPGCARVEVEGVPTGSDPLFWECSLQAADAMPDQTEVGVVVVAADFLTVGFGQDSRVEMSMEDKGWRDPRFASTLTGLEEIATAVATGKFEETTWHRHRWLMKSVGVLDLSDGPYRVTGRHTLMPLWGCPRVTQLYRGYGRPAESSSARRSR